MQIRKCEDDFRRIKLSLVIRKPADSHISIRTSWNKDNYPLHKTTWCTFSRGILLHGCTPTQVPRASSRGWWYQVRWEERLLNIFRNWTVSHICTQAHPTLPPHTYPDPCDCSISTWYVFALTLRTNVGDWIVPLPPRIPWQDTALCRPENIHTYNIQEIVIQNVLSGWVWL